MLPQSHIAYTLAAFNLAQKLTKKRLGPERVQELQHADYRLVALAATGSDLFDKPLSALYFYRRFRSALLFAHTLLAYLVMPLVMLWRRPKWWPYVAAFVGHALLDRLWFFPDTFLWPLRGWRFHVWQHGAEEGGDIKQAYWRTFTRLPGLWAWEVGGLVAGLWFVVSNGLYRIERLGVLLRTGRLPD